MDKSLNTDLVTAVRSSLGDLQTDVAQRNAYISTRENYLYGNGLFNQIDFEINQWFAEYNYLQRVIDIHTSQLMGRPFNVYSYYNKIDLSPYETDPQQMELMQLENKKKKARADIRKKAVDAIIRDNGGFAKFKDGARTGSAFGITIFKQWFDDKEKMVKISLLESPQNYWAGWADSNFRERDFDAYVWQISTDRATRDYGNLLGEGEKFEETKFGEPLTVVDPNTRTPQTSRTMVTVTEFNGFLKGWKAGGSGKLVKAKPGEETPVNVLIVGGKVAQIITDQKKLPKYYIINNRQEPRAAWGKSDLPQSALDINQEIVQLEADAMTWNNKNIFKLIKAKGFTPEGIPKKKPRKQAVVAMSPEQDLEEMNVSSQSLSDVRGLIESKIQSFVRITGIGRVLFDDPTVEANSNQALMTMLKPVIDIVEDKQSRWEPVLAQMFTDGLKLAAAHIDELKDAVLEDDDWFLCIEWPSVLRREDAAYQTMWLNQIQGGYTSLETYHEKMGMDYSEEIDRIRDEMGDKVVAAILGRQLPVLAQQEIAQGMIPQGVPGDQGPAPTLTPDQNTGQAVSQPGSGQPAVSPEGAVAQNYQNAGV